LEAADERRAGGQRSVLTMPCSELTMVGDLQALAEQGYEGAESSDQDCRPQAVSRFISDTVAI
jgi:hypothetical protein